MKRSLIKLSYITAILTAGSSPAFSSAPVQDGEQSGQQGVEEIIVTASRLAAVNRKISPVSVTTSQDIAASGQLGADDLLRLLPEAGYVAFHDQNTVGGVNSVRGDAASMNLRGLGTGNSLFLLNGRRMVNHSSFQTENLVPVMSPNTNEITVAGIRQLEILRDGAAALYGTDAVAGVVNTLMDTAYQGVSVSGRYNFSDGTDLSEWQLNTKVGHSFNQGQGHFVFYASYNKRDGIRTSARDYAATSDLRPFLVGTPFEGDSNFDNRSNRTPWGAFEAIGGADITLADGTVLTDANGRFYTEPCDQGACLTPSNPGRGTYYDWMSGWTLIPDRERFTAYSHVSHKVTDQISWYGEASYYKASSSRNREPSAIISSHRILVPASNYWNPFGATTLADGSENPNRLPDINIPDSGLDVLLRSYRVVDGGERTIDVDNNSFRLLSGVKGTLGAWDVDSAILYARSKTTDVTHNRVSNTLFQQALALNTPDAYNPFSGGDPVNPSLGDATASAEGTIDSFLVDVYRRGRTSLTLADVKFVNQSILNAPAGAIGLVLGAEWRRESYTDDRDDRLDGTIPFVDLVSGQQFGSDVMNSSPTADSRGRRHVWSVFAEASLPLISPDMQIPLVQSAGLNFAARYEDISDVGDTLKPKISAYWTVNDTLTLRGAWSKGFRAPNLVQINDKGISRVNNRVDYVRCQAMLEQGLIAGLDDCSAEGTESVRSGSETLKPEHTKNTTFGAVFTPDFIEGLTLSVDYFDIRQQGVVGVFGDQNHITLDLLLRASGAENPQVTRAAVTAADEALFAGTSLAAAGEIIFVADTYSNLDNRVVQGYDFNLTYELPVSFLERAYLRLNASHISKFDQQPGALGQQLLDAVATGDLPGEAAPEGFGALDGFNARPKWRGSATLGFKHQAWRGSVFLSHVGGFFDTSATQNDTGAYWRVNSWTVTNLTLGYDFSEGSSLSGMSATIGVNNVFDRDPPLADESFGFYGSVHSANGRMIYLNLGYQF